MKDVRQVHRPAPNGHPEAGHDTKAEDPAEIVPDEVDRTADRPQLARKPTGVVVLARGEPAGQGRGEPGQREGKRFSGERLLKRIPDDPRLGHAVNKYRGHETKRRRRRLGPHHLTV